MIESADQQGLSGASMPVLWQHRSLTKKVIGVLAAAQLQYGIPYCLTLQTVQCSCLPPFIWIIFVIVSNPEHIHGCSKVGLIQPFFEIGLAHHLGAIDLSGNLLYMYKHRNISWPVIAYAHNVLSPGKDFYRYSHYRTFQGRRRRRPSYQLINCLINCRLDWMRLTSTRPSESIARASRLKAPS